ncbi:MULTISPECIES: hypothetical protein [Paraburkholderia]|jgi:hypothetical protein|uniref:Uncharacterized protein n=1 Tax=Paraburkholderia largidicola TaxID=3014751 RepID=A0A7I8BPD2_9BURK|nr:MULTISPECIES: hypothetical protein [Paraburkholderia]BCF90554.1 hypothetical protein PPGU16_36210 [Paraburkholderia sp. PGU16]BEU24353.1 hypothetical protein PBP221_44930 [Paraburkholderia sp. 22B1P]GJH05226.1 hypothetical protein CBA19C8_31735 [Paraburkholderia terrae]
MKVRVANEGDAPIRLIVDGDPVLGETIEAGAEMVVDGEVVELQDLEPGQEDESDEEEQ